MEKHVIKFKERETEKVRTVRAESVESLKGRFSDGGTFSHLELLSVYDYETYLNNFEQKVEYSDGLVRFGEKAFEDRRNVGDF